MRNFRFSSIQRRLGWIFLAYLILLVISVGLTFAGLDTQKQDARMINLAGRQQMLLHQIASLALSLDRDDADKNPSALLESASSFEQTLTALRGGGQIRDYTGEIFTISPTDDPVVNSELEALQKDWQVIRSKIDLLVKLSPAEDGASLIQEIEDLAHARLVEFVFHLIPQRRRAQALFRDVVEITLLAHPI